MKYNNIKEALESGNKVTTKNFKGEYIQKTEMCLIDENGFLFDVQALVDNEILKVSDLFEEWYDYEEELTGTLKELYDYIIETNLYSHYNKDGKLKMCKEIIEIIKPQD